VYCTVKEALCVYFTVKIGTLCVLYSTEKHNIFNLQYRVALLMCIV